MINYKIEGCESTLQIKGPAIVLCAELECMVQRCIKQFAEIKNISYDAAKLEIMCDIAKVEAIEEMRNK